MKVAHEVDELHDLLARREQLEPGRREVAGQALDVRERPLQHRAEARGQPLSHVFIEIELAMQIDRRAHRDDRREAGGLAKRGGLVTKHAALRIAGEVDVLAGRRTHAIDRVGHRTHVIVERAIHAAFFALGCAEVGQPHVYALACEVRDRARVRGDVVDLRRDHQRRDQEQRSGDRLFLGRVTTQPIHALLVNDLERRTVRRGQSTGACDLERVVPRQTEPAKTPPDPDLPTPPRRPHYCGGGGA